jgi:Fe(3+) dicitrate transport protein
MKFISIANKTKTSLYILLFMCASAHATWAQQNEKGIISGVVSDSLGKPADFVNIGLKETRYGTVTDEKGRYELKAPAGSYSIQISAVGFRTISREVTIISGQRLELNFRLPRKATTLKEVNITAGGTMQDIKDVPGTVNIIDARQIRESGAQSVGQLISRVPGVNYLDEDGRGLKPNIGLRGLDPIRNRNLLVLVDGKFPIGMTYYGDPAAYYVIPLEQAARIEVIKGASPVLYGGYSVGGVINVVTRKATPQPLTTIKASYGSFNSLTSQITNSRDNGKTNHYFSALRRQGDGFRERSNFVVNDYTLRFGGTPDSTTEYSLYLNAFSENSETPGGLTQEQYEANPVQSRHKHDEFFARRFSAAFSYKKIYKKNHTFSISPYGNYFSRDWWIASGDTSNSAFLRDIHSMGALADYNFTGNFLKRKNSLIAGVRLHTDRLDDINARGKAGGSRSGITYGNKVNNSFIYELFLYDEFNVFKNLTIAPGIRYTSVSYKRNDLFTGLRSHMDVTAFVYSGGMIYKIKSHTRLFATVSKGFNPPTLNSSLDPATVKAGVDLLPEYSTNIEAGFRTEPVKWMSFSASVYQLDFRNKVISEGGVNRNAGSSNHRGIETELELGAWHGFTVFANGTLQKAIFSNGADNGNLLPNAPQHLLSSGLRYRLHLIDLSDKLKGDLILNLFDTYVGKQYTDSKNTEAASADGKSGAIPAYHVMNATVSYGWKKWEVFCNINNLLDEKYYTIRLKGSAGSGWYGVIPSPNRNFMAGVNLKF